MDITLLEKQTMSRRIIMNGEYRTRRNSGSFVLNNGSRSFIEELQVTGAADAVFGEFTLRIDGDGEADFDNQRAKLGLQLTKPVQGITRANIAFARFVVVKGYSSLPPEVAVRRAGLLDYASVFGVMPDPTEFTLLSEALRLDMETTDGAYNINGVGALLLVDKVYVAEVARRCGISEYIHTNLADITHVYTGVRPKLAILNCGDFSNAYKTMGITELEYKHILRKHYERSGYKSVAGASPFIMSKLF